MNTLSIVTSQAELLRETQQCLLEKFLKGQLAKKVKKSKAKVKAEVKEEAEEEGEKNGTIWYSKVYRLTDGLTEIVPFFYQRLSTYLLHAV